MNRREFNLIAETIATLPILRDRVHISPTFQPHKLVSFDALVNCFADALRTTNPRFNRERFISACNGKDGR